jgi:hypothetical protein
VVATVSGGIVVAAAILIATRLRREQQSRPVLAPVAVAAEPCA